MSCCGTHSVSPVYTIFIVFCCHTLVLVNSISSGAHSSAPPSPKASFTHARAVRRKEVLCFMFVVFNQKLQVFSSHQQANSAAWHRTVLISALCLCSHLEAAHQLFDLVAPPLLPQRLQPGGSLANQGCEADIVTSQHYFNTAMMCNVGVYQLTPQIRNTEPISMPASHLWRAQQLTAAMHRALP
jgi:hypothetical protein